MGQREYLTRRSLRDEVRERLERRWIDGILSVQSSSLIELTGPRRSTMIGAMRNTGSIGQCTRISPDWIFESPMNHVRRNAPERRVTSSKPVEVGR